MAAKVLSRSCVQSSRSAPAAARALLQLAAHRPHPVLDFLAPCVTTSRQHVSPRAFFPSPPGLPSASRTFSVSSSRRDTVAVHNPRRDDDGLDMNVEITPRASSRLREIMDKDANPNLALRITVESGGCHGFQYLMSLTTLSPLAPPGKTSSPAAPAPQEDSLAPNTSSSDPNAMLASASPSDSSTAAASMDEDDTVFQSLDGSGAKVVMDGPSLELLKGSKIDYTMELIGSQFKIVDNPLATSSCGCGTSFDIKA